MLCFVMLFLIYIYCFFPLFSPVDPEAVDVTVIDYVTDNPSSLSAELPGKPPLWSSQYRPFHYLMLALDFVTVIDCSYSDAYPAFVTCYCTLHAYLKLLSICWLVIHQWPHLVPVAPALSPMARSTGSMSWAQHITSHSLRSMTLQCYYRLPRVIPCIAL